MELQHFLHCQDIVDAPAQIGHDRVVEVDADKECALAHAMPPLSLCVRSAGARTAQHCDCRSLSRLGLVVARMPEVVCRVVGGWSADLAKERKGAAKSSLRFAGLMYAVRSTNGSLSGKQGKGPLLYGVEGLVQAAVVGWVGEVVGAPLKHSGAFHSSGKGKIGLIAHRLQTQLEDFISGKKCNLGRNTVHERALNRGGDDRSMKTVLF